MSRKRYTQIPEDYGSLPYEEQVEIAMDLANHISAQLADRPIEELASELDLGDEYDADLDDDRDRYDDYGDGDE